MGRTQSVTVEKRANSYKEHKFYVSDSSILMCGYCNLRLEWEKKDTLDKHIKTSSHVNNKLKSEKEAEQGRSKKRQATIPLMGALQKKAKTEKRDFIDETVRMCLKANIPMHKLDHPAVREYFKKYIPGSGDLPSSTTLRRDYVAPVGDSMKEDIRIAMEGKPMVVVADETSDSKGRCVLAILFRTVSPSATQDVYLASCSFLESATGSTCCQAIVECLQAYKIDFKNVLGLVSDSARYMGTCYRAVNTLVGEHMLHLQCWAHKVNLAGDIFMKELSELNILVVKIKMAFLNSRKLKSAYLQFLKEHHPTLSPKLFPCPIITRWNSWFHSVDYLNTYLDPLVEFFKECEHTNNSSEFIVTQFESRAMANKLKLQVTFVSEVCSKFITLINALEGSKYPYAHLLWEELLSMCTCLKRYSDGAFPQQTLNCLSSLTNAVEREAAKAKLRECCQKSHLKLNTHMAPGTTNNFYKAAGELFNPRLAARSRTPNDETIKANKKQLSATCGGLTENTFVEEYHDFHRLLVNQTQEDSGVDLVQTLLAMKTTNPEFADAALKTIWMPVNSVDAERFFSRYNLVLTDRRTSMKEETLETCAMLTFNT